MEDDFRQEQFSRTVRVAGICLHPWTCSLSALLFLLLLSTSLFLSHNGDLTLACSAQPQVFTVSAWTFFKTMKSISAQPSKILGSIEHSFLLCSQTCIWPGREEYLRRAKGWRDGSSGRVPS
jgi:hypothetical protein